MSSSLKYVHYHILSFPIMLTTHPIPFKLNGSIGVKKYKSFRSLTNLYTINPNRKVIKQKSHKERSQLTSRSKYGLLEKHKDYVLRARDYHKKQDRLTNLKRKATTRNPDEFYFAMQSAKTAKGIHLSGTETKKRLAKRFSNDELKIIREQDDKYLWMARQINRKKLEKLKEQMHLVQDDDEDDDVNKDMMKLDQDLSGSEQDQEESDDEFSKWLKEGKSDDDQHQNNASTKPKLPKHTIFVDDEKEGMSILLYLSILVVYEKKTNHLNNS